MAIKKSDIYRSLWGSCDQLRGGMDASLYKDYILTLLFVKYVSDRAGQTDALIDVPKGCSFADLRKLRGTKDIGEGIDKAIAGIAEANDLNDVIDCQSASKRAPLSACKRAPCAMGWLARCGVASISRSRIGPAGHRVSGTGLEAPALVAGLDDVAVVGDTIEQRGRHLGIAEDCGPFPEGEVGGHDDRGAFVEAADQVEQELATGLGKRQVAKFVEDEEVAGGEVPDQGLVDRRALELELVVRRAVLPLEGPLVRLTLWPAAASPPSSDT